MEPLLLEAYNTILAVRVNLVVRMPLSKRLPRGPSLRREQAEKLERKKLAARQTSLVVHLRQSALLRATRLSESLLLFRNLTETRCRRGDLITVTIATREKD